MLEVVSSGLLTTVQDAGRPGLEPLGVPRGGACDPWARSVANLLVGNEPDAAVLELTVVGPELRVLEPLVIGLAGADLGGFIDGPGRRRLLPGRSHALEAGLTVAFPGPSDAVGARAFLALPGGIDVPPVLGSRSTCLPGGFGGIDGRPLRAGDVVRAATPLARPPEVVWPTTLDEPTPSGPIEIRVLPGPAAAPRQGRAAFDELVADSWRVASASDRMGLRLDGPSVGGAEALSHGVTWGAVQVPPDGRPIVLLADAQPTGGYAVVAVAIVADRPRLGQARPGTSLLRFVPTSEREARAALADQQERLATGAAALGDAGRWDALWRSAGG